VSLQQKSTIPETTTDSFSAFFQLPFRVEKNTASGLFVIPLVSCLKQPEKSPYLTPLLRYSYIPIPHRIISLTQFSFFC